MNLHEAEWVAGELIAFTLAALALISVARQHNAQETTMDDPEQEEMSDL